MPSEKVIQIHPHWSDVTTGEVGSRVREAIKRGEQAITNEVKANGEAHQNF
jgi:small acid-soluble spore protein F (minor alpha/beta-type SASP)